MPKATQADLFAELRNLETRCAKAVCSVHGTLSDDEVGRLAVLRQQLGLTWDASDRRWLASSTVKTIKIAPQATRFYWAAAEQPPAAYPEEDWEYTLLMSNEKDRPSEALCFADGSMLLRPGNIVFASAQAYIDSLDEESDINPSSLSRQIIRHHDLLGYEIESKEKDDWEPYSWLYRTLPDARRAVPRDGTYRIVSTCGQETVEVWISGERYLESNMGLQLMD